MAVDFGLLGQQTPLKSQFTPADAVGATRATYTLAGEMVDTQEKMRAQQESAQDRAAIKEFMSGGGDLHTPTGVKSALTALQGRISPDAYMRLGQHASAVAKADLDFNTKLQAMKDTDLAAYDAGLERSMPLLAELKKQYDTDLSIGGKASADAKFNDARGRMLSTIQQQMASTGTPLYPAEVLNAIKSMEPAALDGVLAASKYQKGVVEQRLKAAQADRAAAEAKAFETGKSFVPYTDKAGNNYLYSAVGGIVVKVDPATGERVRIPNLPPDATPTGSTQTAKMLATGALDEVKLTNEENAWLANYQGNLGKSIPGIPAGAGNNFARMAYIKEFVKQNMAKGYTGEEAGSVALQRDVSREALKKMITQNAIIVSGEKDLENVLDTIKEEIKKVGGPDSPLVRRYMNRAFTEVLGDPAFTGLNAAWANFQETGARVLSGQTGAGSTPVSYLKLAQESLGTNPNLAQVMKLDETMRKLFKARERAFDETRKQVLLQAQATPKPGTPASEKAESRNAERVNVLRSEYDKEAARARDTAAAPEERARARANVRTVREELKALGVDVPDLSADTAPTPAAGGGKELTTKSGKKFTVTVE